MNEQSPQAIEDCFQGVMHYIESAKAMLSAGQFIEMKELSPMVDALTSRVLALPQPLPQEMSDRLDELALSLGHLKTAMEHARQQLTSEMKATTQRHKALRLYTNKPTQGDA